MLNKIKKLINNFKSNTELQAELRAELEQKEEECENLKNQLKDYDISLLCSKRMTAREVELHNLGLKARAELNIAEQLQVKEQECAKLKEDKYALIQEIDKILCSDCTNINTLKGKPFDYWFNLEKEIEQVKKFVAGLMFDVDCTNWFERFVVAFEDWKAELGNDRDKYKKALDEISNDINFICEVCVEEQEDNGEHRACDECNLEMYKNIINDATNNKTTDKTTNRDKLNRMSNEEFANWLTDNDDASELVNCKMCLFCASDKYDNGKWKCIQCCDEDFRCKLGIEEWLNAESEQ